MITRSKVGTRGSKLAVAQTQIALNALRKTNPSVSFEPITISTRGDIDNRPIFTIDQKGVFEKEVNEAVIKCRVDFAVHSLKDIPSDLSDKLTIACVPKRAKPNDVLVNQKKIKLKDLPTGSLIGTSSLRRAIQIMRKRSDLNVKPIRGNVETRVNKSAKGEFDAVVLAEAGLTRLDMNNVIAEIFSIKDFLPSPGQGAIAIVCRSDDLELIKILRSIEDPSSRAEIDAERSLLTKIQGGCRFPVGICAITEYDKSKITLYASIFSADGTESIEIKESGSKRDPDKLGIKAANLLLNAGAIRLAEGWRDAVKAWNSK
ncbi:MAG TPA: hydroxymethylbilane synthase [Nitrososphaeraceae archaeon]|nr:hydroxymethylbilane synthase [Nitrososphaeraceae archaeon]